MCPDPFPNQQQRRGLLVRLKFRWLANRSDDGQLARKNATCRDGQNGYDVRYSILLRRTTDEMRELGTRQKAFEPRRHAESYREAVMLYPGGLTDYLRNPIA
jgi:hypothetical protein